MPRFTGAVTVFSPPADSNPASMVGSILLASEVLLLLLVPTPSIKLESNVRKKSYVIRPVTLSTLTEDHTLTLKRQ
jgi:hypothetical protein